MPNRPGPMPALDVEPERVRQLIGRAGDLVGEFLERLPSLPVDRPRTVEEVREVVARPIPREGLGRRRADGLPP